METELLNYDLPAELIAQSPAKRRDQSRLLVLDRKDGRITDTVFSRIGRWINPGDCLVINNTKVLGAKFFAERRTGGRIEGLFLNETCDGCWLTMLKNASRLKTGEVISLLDRSKNPYSEAEIKEKLDAGRWIIKPPEAAEKLLSAIGFAPLPPYIKRPVPADEHAMDSKRYQTVYASQAGAVAAPTAGLHFTEEIISGLKNKGVSVAQLTLHVGEGTFLPVKADNLNQHKMHSERFSLDSSNAQIINDAIGKGGRIVAVGTTTVRTLESIAAGRGAGPASGETDIFIMPGFEFKIVDCMITNFHLPKSTLLALVAAFAGLDTIKSAYRYAIEQRYRFYSYGDCMMII